MSSAAVQMTRWQRRVHPQLNLRDLLLCDRYRLVVERSVEEINKWVCRRPIHDQERFFRLSETTYKIRERIWDICHRYRSDLKILKLGACFVDEYCC